MKLLALLVLSLLSAPISQAAEPPPPAPKCSGVDAWQVTLTKRHATLEALLDAQISDTYPEMQASARRAICGRGKAKTCAGGMYRAPMDSPLYEVALPDPKRPGAFVVKEEACWGGTEFGFTVTCEVSSRVGPLFVINDTPSPDRYQLYDAETGKLLIASSARITVHGKGGDVTVDGCGTWTAKALRAGAKPDKKLMRWVSPAEKHVQLGRKLTAKGDYQAAISMFSLAISKDEGLAVAWSGRGYAKHKAGKHKAAIADFKQAVWHNPTDHFAAKVHYNIGQCHDALGDASQAVDAYELASEKGSTAAGELLEARFK